MLAGAFARGHGGRITADGRTAGDEEIIAFPCEVDHGCDATGSAGVIRAFFAGMELPVRFL